MSESFLGDGLIFDEALPVVFTPGALAEGLALARLNSDNHQLLGAESSLDEIRVHDALKEESPALIHELQRLEYKVNILLRLTAELTLRNSGVPAPQRVKLTSRALEWFSGEAPPVGASGLLAVYVNSALPQPVKIPCVVAGERIEDNARVTQLRFNGLSDAVTEQLDKLIFRHHRRLIAGAKAASN